MVILKQYRSDVKKILAKRRINGGDNWTSSDGRIGVGSPFCNVSCISILSEVALRALCRAGYKNDPRIVQTFKHLLENMHTDGGWGS